MRFTCSFRVFFHNPKHEDNSCPLGIIRRLLVANIKSAKKRAKIAIEGGNKEEASKAYTEATPLIDGLVNKGLIHKNKAARHKSQSCSS